jgi:hypothetical protein
MPDWTRLVRERLDLRSLSPEEQEQTTAELASHLDDLCGEYRAEGLSESEAVTRAIHEVTDWHGLAKNIQRAKQEETMNPRTKQLWLPGLINLTAAMLVSLFEVHLDFHPRVLTEHSGTMLFYIPFYTPWLASLPFCGALAAYLCRRAGGDLWTRLASASFPAAAYLGFFALVLPIACFGPHFVPWATVAVVVCAWVLMPAAALLLGALPFLSTGKPAGSPALS